MSYALGNEPAAGWFETLPDGTRRYLPAEVQPGGAQYLGGDLQVAETVLGDVKAKAEQVADYYAVVQGFKKTSPEYRQILARLRDATARSANQVKRATGAFRSAQRLTGVNRERAIAIVSATNLEVERIRADAGPLRLQARAAPQGAPPPAATRAEPPPAAARAASPPVVSVPQVDEPVRVPAQPSRFPLLLAIAGGAYWWMRRKKPARRRR